MHIMQWSLTLQIENVVGIEFIPFQFFIVGNSAVGQYERPQRTTQTVRIRY